MRSGNAPKISIGSWAYTLGPYADNPIPLPEVVRRLNELGFDEVELGGFNPMPIWTFIRRKKTEAGW